MMVLLLWIPISVRVVDVNNLSSYFLLTAIPYREGPAKIIYEWKEYVSGLGIWYPCDNRRGKAYEGADVNGKPRHDFRCRFRSDF